MQSKFAVVYCHHINITGVCHCIDTNTITNKETKANIKDISFWNNKNVETQGHLNVISKTITIANIFI